MYIKSIVVWPLMIYAVYLFSTLQRRCMPSVIQRFLIEFLVVNLQPLNDIINIENKCCGICKSRFEKFNLQIVKMSDIARLLPIFHSHKFQFVEFIFFACNIIIIKAYRGIFTLHLHPRTKFSRGLMVSPSSK